MNTNKSSLSDEIDAILERLYTDFADANPDSRRRYQNALANMPGGNTRTNLFYEPFPLTIARGEGARLWDVDGHEYVDLIGEYTAGVYGHSAPEIREAVHRAMVQGINFAGNNLFEGQLAELVCKRFASVERVRFTNSGTEANLMALNAAIGFTGRKKIVVFEGGYHGGMISFGMRGAPTNAPYDFVLLEYNDRVGVREAFARLGDSIAAVLVEPMLGASGCIPASPDFLATLRAATERSRSLLIFDEVMTSRLAGGGLQATLGIRPDLTTLGKYIGGGMSFGAFGGRADVMQQFDPRAGRLAHAGTFNNNVVTMAAGIAGLSQLFPPAAADALSARGERMRAALNEVCEAHGVPMQFIGVGSVMNAHFTSKAVTSIRDIADVDIRLRKLLFMSLLAEGFYLAPRGFTVLSLPLSDDDIAQFVAAVERYVVRYAPVIRALG